MPGKSKPAEKTAKSPASEGVHDSPGPKRSISAYMFFAKEKRAEVVAANPDIGPKLVLSRLGEMWKEISTEQKTKYEGLATADKARYERQKREFESQGRFYDESGQVVTPSLTAKKEKKPSEAASDEAKGKKPRRKTTA